MLDLCRIKSFCAASLLTILKVQDLFLYQNGSQKTCSARRTTCAQALEGSIARGTVPIGNYVSARRSAWGTSQQDDEECREPRTTGLGQNGGGHGLQGDVAGSEEGKIEHFVPK